MSNAPSKTKSTSTDEELAQALHRIHKIYGANLDAFFTDVHRRLELERSEQAPKHVVMKIRLSR